MTDKMSAVNFTLTRVKQNPIPLSAISVLWLFFSHNYKGSLARRKMIRYSLGNVYLYFKKGVSALSFRNRIQDFLSLIL